MAMGLPVVGFDTGGETELVRIAGHGLLVPNRSSAALARAAEELLTASDRGSSLGHRGLEYARARLDIRRAIAVFSEQYSRLGAAFTGGA